MVMLGIYELFKKGAEKIPENDYILQEAEVENISGAQEYAGKSWGEIKATLSQGNPIIKLLNSLIPILAPLTNTIGALISASFLSITKYKNPIKAVQEDINTILKGGATLLTLSAILALAWKGAAVWIAFDFVKKKLK